MFCLHKCQYEADARDHHERQERKKLTKKVKEIHTKLGIDACCSPIDSEGKVSDMETSDARKARMEEDHCTQWYGDASLNGYGYGYGGVTTSTRNQPPSFSPRHAESPIRSEEEGASEEEECDDDDDDA